MVNCPLGRDFLFPRYNLLEAGRIIEFLDLEIPNAMSRNSIGCLEGWNGEISRVLVVVTASRLSVVGRDILLQIGIVSCFSVL